jgi:hypothetical protein
MENHSPSGAEPLWTSQQTADYLGLATRTLWDWRQRGYGPAWIELIPGKQGKVRYDPHAVREWLAERTTPAAPPEKVSA